MNAQKPHGARCESCEGSGWDERDDMHCIDCGGHGRYAHPWEMLIKGARGALEMPLKFGPQAASGDNTFIVGAHFIYQLRQAVEAIDEARSAADMPTVRQEQIAQAHGHDI